MTDLDGNTIRFGSPLRSRYSTAIVAGPSQAFSPTTTNDWAAIDRTLMVKYATEAPFLNGVLTSFFSSNMNPNCDVFDD